MKNYFINTFILLALFTSLPVLARDISHEQQAAYDARLRLEDANAEYEDSIKQIDKQNKLLARDQAKLKELQDKQVAAKKALENAQADKEVKDKILNEAWEQRDK